MDYFSCFEIHGIARKITKRVLYVVYLFVMNNFQYSGTTMLIFCYKLKCLSFSPHLKHRFILQVKNAIEYLKIIGALDEKEELTVLGRVLFLPLFPIFQ